MRQQINHASGQKGSRSKAEGLVERDGWLVVTLLFAWVFVAHAGLLALAAPLGDPFFNQAKADDTEKGNNERSDACERHLSAEAAGETAVLDIGISVKGDECHRAGAKPGGQVVIGGFHAFVGYLVAHDAHEIDQLNTPAPHR